VSSKVVPNRIKERESKLDFVIVNILSLKLQPLNYFEALSVFSIYIAVSPQKSEKLPHQVVAP